jgi:hypothetical protein
MKLPNELKISQSEEDDVLVNEGQYFELSDMKRNYIEQKHMEVEDALQQQLKIQMSSSERDVRERIQRNI